MIGKNIAVASVPINKRAKENSIIVVREASI
jgi:hypothetical protein